MKTIQLDAREIMQSDEPVKAVGSYFGIEDNDLLSLQRKLEDIKEYLQVEVFHWPVDKELWVEIGNMLEAVQQHSAYFFLIWGAADKWEVLPEKEAAHV